MILDSILGGLSSLVPDRAIFGRAIDDVIDMHTMRISAVVDRLPAVVLVMLVFIASIALAIPGFNAGLSVVIGRGRWRLFALVLSSVMYVIVDFDRPRDGFIRVGQASMLAQINEMELTLDLGVVLNCGFIAPK